MLYTQDTPPPAIPEPPPATNSGSFGITTNVNGAFVYKGSSASIPLFQSNFAIGAWNATGALSAAPSGLTVIFSIPSSAGTGAAIFHATTGTASGTYTVTLTFTSAGQTAVLYLTIIVAADPTPGAPPANSNGLFNILFEDSTLEVGQNSSCQPLWAIWLFTAGVYHLTATWTALPPECIPFAYPNPFFISGPSGAAVTIYGQPFYLFASATAPPGSYTMTLQVSDGTHTASASITIVVSVTGPANFKQLAKSSRGKTGGIVRTNSKSGLTLRRLSIPVQPRTVRQTLWRHKFLTPKQNWQGIGANGQNNAPTNGIDPQTAWLVQNISFISYRIPVDSVDGVKGMPLPSPLATAEAYMVMVQTTMASMGLPPLPTPATTTIAAVATTSPVSISAGAYTLGATIPAQATYPLGPFVCPVTLSPPLTAPATFPLTLGYSDAHISAVLSSSNITTSVNCTVTIDTAAPPGTHYVGVTIQISGSFYTLFLSFTVSSVSLTALYPSPLFSLWSSISATTYYDATYTPIGFVLSINSISGFTYPMSVNGHPTPGLWQFTASPAYPAGGTKPATSTYNAIGYIAGITPDYIQLLALWTAYYGDLPGSGSIAFLVKYADPSSGCVSGALTVTATWETGTLRGFDRASWLGPLWKFTLIPPAQHTSASTTITVTVGATGSPNNFGIGPLPGTPFAGNITLKASVPVAYRTGITLSWGTQPIVIPSGNVTQHTSVLTITVAPAYPAASFTVSVSGTDGISTSYASFTLSIS